MVKVIEWVNNHCVEIFAGMAMACYLMAFGAVIIYAICNWK
jgi:hypothetical protein